MNTNLQYVPEGNENIEIKLWEYIDGICTPSEKLFIEKLIAENKEWRDKYNELLDLNALIQGSELEVPSMRFTKNVMEEITRLHIAPATKNYINKKVVWGIAAFFITVIAAFVIYAIGQVDWSTGSANNSIGIDFTKVDYSRMLSNDLVNIFIMANIVLGLMLFDRYLTNKKSQIKALE